MLIDREDLKKMGIYVMEVVDMVVGQRGLKFPYLMQQSFIFGHNSFFLVFWLILSLKFFGVVLPFSKDVVVPANERFFFFTAEIFIKGCSFLQHYIIDY